MIVYFKINFVFFVCVRRCLYLLLKFVFVIGLLWVWFCKVIMFCFFLVR